MNKFMRNLLVTLAVWCFLPLTASAHQVIDPHTQQAISLAPMLKKATPAVVNVTVGKVLPPKTDEDSLQPKSAGLKAVAVGSGVIIDSKKGYIVTNSHIIKNQKVMIVTLKDGRRYHAKLIGTADGYDIAVLQIHAKKLTAMPIGNSGHLNVGDFVVAIGSPFGLSQTVTSGVVSALNRATPKIEGFQDFIQTDAPINPGNSGGALIDDSGKLIGMNTAILAPSAGNIGIGFAIPSNMVKNVAEQLIKYGKIQPGLLGVVAQNITPELADAMQLKDTKGVLITQIMPNSPADKAGLQTEDVILKVDDDPITSAAQLHNLLGITHPKTKIHVSILRNSKHKTMTALVGDPKDKMQQRIIPYLSGLRLKDFNDLEPDSTMIQGVMALSVSETSPGMLAGLFPGDVIVSANGKSIGSVRDLVSIAAHSRHKLLLKVVRGSTNLYLVIRPDQ